MAKKPVFDVLLVDADPKEMDLYSDLIREVADCKVDVMNRVGRSFDWIARSNYHLIVIDTSSARSFTGKSEALELLEHVRRANPGTGVILISEKANVEEAVAAIRLGAEDYFKKPFNLETFKLAVKRSLDRKLVLGDNEGLTDYLNLLNSCQMISATLDRRKIFDIVRSFFSQELHSHHSAIYTLRDNQAVRVDISDVPEAITPQDSDPDRAMWEIMDIALYAVNPFPKMVESDEYYRFVDRGQLTPALFVFRFHCAGEDEYFCVCLSPRKPVAVDAFENRLRMLKRQIEVTGRNIQEYLGVQNLVYLDDATGLYNTRYLNTILDREIAQAKTTAKSFAVLFIDADHFKKINDSYGHLSGTNLLNELGSHLKGLVRDRDTVFRYGGDEFVAVLSSCDLQTATAVAERIRRSVEQKEFLAKDGLNVHFTVSIGVALFPDHADSKQAIIELADSAMYSAKRKSRNAVSVVSAQTPGPSPAPLTLAKNPASATKKIPD